MGWDDIKKSIHEVCERSLQGVKKRKPSKWMSKHTLEIAQKRREAKAKGERETTTELNRVFQRAARRDKEKYYNDAWKEEESEITRGKTRSAFLKLQKRKAPHSKFYFGF